MKEEFGYFFNVKNKDMLGIVNEIIQLLNYLKVIYDKREKDKMKNQYNSNETNSEESECVNERNEQSDMQSSEENSFYKNDEIILNDNNNGMDINIESDIDKQSSVLHLLGIKTIFKDSKNFFFYKFLNTTSPVFLLDNKKGSLKFNRVKYTLKCKNGGNNITYHMSKEEEEELARKEKFVVDVLSGFNLINIKQNEKHYFFYNLLPIAKDGQFIGKIINIFEGKKDNLLKGISNQTYSKNNIKLNFTKIFRFLGKKGNFKSQFEFVEEFYNDQYKLFNFIYEIIEYYMKNRKVLYKRMEHHQKQITLERNNSLFEMIANSKKINNAPSKNITQDFEREKNSKKVNIGRNILNIKNSYFQYINNNHANTVFNLVYGDTRNEKRNQKKKENLFQLRKNITYDQYLNKRNLSSKSYKEKNKTEYLFPNGINYIDSINDNKKTIPIYGKDKEFDNNVEKIKKWLSSIGIKTKVNFYSKSMEEFKDGTLLYKIVQLLEVNYIKLPKINFTPNKPANSINNIRLIIESLYHIKHKFPAKFLNSEREIYEASPITILNLLESIRDIYKYEVKVRNENNKSFSTFKSPSELSSISIFQKSEEFYKKRSALLSKNIRRRLLSLP